MTRYNSFICLCVSALWVFALASCDKAETEIVYAPVLNVSTVSVTASCAGGAYSFACSVENSTNDGQMTCVGDVAWLSELSYESGTVSFSLSANSGEDARMAHIVLTYSSKYGSASKTVTVIQNSDTTPVLTIRPTGVAADVAGGTYSLTYDIVNPASDGQISCSSDVSWIGGFDYSTSGSVAFRVSTNNDVDMREGVITVLYSYTGGEQSGTVTVVQDFGWGGYSKGDGDVSDVIGSYTVSATVVNTEDSSGTAVMDATWTMRIFAYTGEDDEYDLYLDGWVYTLDGMYNQIGDHRCSIGAYYYSDGRIIVPTQVKTDVVMDLGGVSYFMGCTPCVEYDSQGGFFYSNAFPAATFYTEDSGATYESDYGLMEVAFANTQPTSFTYFLDATLPGIKLTKTSSSTSSTGVSTCGLRHPLGETPWFRARPFAEQ